MVRRANNRFGRFGAYAGLGVAAANSASRLFKRAKRDLGIKRKVRKYHENLMNTRTVGRPIKRPRSMLPPTTTSARISAKYKVADRMTKFKKQKLSQTKVPKSAIAHYREYGEFNSNQVMYVNHEHWGSVQKLWYGIGLGLAKMLCAKAKLYPGKSLEDPMIGPRTNWSLPERQFDDKAGALNIFLVFVTEGVDGATTRSLLAVALEDIGQTPDRYNSMDYVAQTIATHLSTKYNGSNTWLQEASIIVNDTGNNSTLNGIPVYVQNLDDAEIMLYVNSLVKFQNVTLADTGSSTDKQAIDANPLTGRIYSGAGHGPIIDGDLAQAGARTLDTFFGNLSDTTGGITLLGHADTHDSTDLGYIANIPQAKVLYGNQTVKSGVLHMAPGAMKFHKTSFKLTKTFKQLAGFEFEGFGIASGLPQAHGRRIGRHTLFGFTPAHKHGNDAIKIGYNRETDVGCFIKHKRVVHALKTNYTLDSGVTATSVNPLQIAPPY